MKKFFAVAAAVLAVSFAVSAQPRAVGIHFGYGAEASYQHTLGGSNFIEANVGFESFSFLSVRASYNFIVASPKWTKEGEWNVYVGPYAGFAQEKYACFDLGGVAGLEYTFKFPLQLSVDVRPCFRIGGEPAALFRGFWPMLAARYRF